MKSFVKWTGIVIGGIVALLIIAAIGIYVVSNSKINKVYDVEPEAIVIPDADSATIARGVHLVATHYCRDCHGPNLAGKLFIDEMPMARVSSANLTPAGIGATYSDADWVRAIRHGVGRDGKSFWVMPSQAFTGLSEADLGAMIAYLKTIPAVASDEPVKEVGPLGRLLIAVGGLHLPADEADHDRPFPLTPPEGPTAEYGNYWIDPCRSCHGANLSGGIASGPPDSPVSANLTAHESGIAHYTEADFFRTLREGKKPDGTQMDNEFMPWMTTAAMTDVEIQALWAYLQTLEPRAKGS